MYAIISRDSEARRQWLRALSMVYRGEPSREIIRATGVKRSTYFYRLAKERELRGYDRQPIET